MTANIVEQREGRTASEEAAMPTGRNIALFLDGTWNIVDNNTNVWRAKSLCINNEKQITYYSQGVGTFVGEHVMGGAFGYGLDKEVTRAYEWLLENYHHGTPGHPNDPSDRIFIFGFSRGAYTARALSGLISKLGLLKAGSPLSIDQLYARYRLLDPRSIRQLQNVPESQRSSLANEERWLLAYSQPIAIWFVGVWDTVGALGLPFGNLPFSRKQYRFLQTDLWITNDFAFHALALDEHRKTFAPTLWTWPRHRDDETATGIYAFPTSDKVEQRWFVGAHANVGGGYNDDLLAQRPLKWLIDKAKDKGLEFKNDVMIDGDDLQAPVNNSFQEMAHGWYSASHLWQPYYRKIGTVPTGPDDVANNVVNETIDASVFDRWRANSAYRPKNLAEWASRMGVDVGTIQGPVRADDPKVKVT